ncbi:c-type cytochrome domain-containing protein [Paraliomyxa miuraensis]|uniref:c-type cytochrome domain-containing protein n=1 Tax=Paraliomyxa miuraensis TaxID=376150 RepID=UPI00224E2890|nr:c-type cytochrome domain-containing protein [Paraliomyxa miuraensis]MCX4246401.1 hypothetical protein [Paraliomyxa miuraensis]
MIASSRSATPRMLALATTLVLAAACNDDTGDDEGSACVPRDASACMPLYEPTWDRVFEQTLVPRCGTAGAACHADTSAIGGGGGFVVGDMTSTHAALIDHGFMVPGDAACSELIVRLDTDDDALRMPPGSQTIDEPERCAVAQWVENGAPP